MMSFWTSYGTNSYPSSIITYHPILIRVYSRKRGWPDFPHSNSNLSNSHSPSRWIQGILLLQTNTLALLLYLRLPHIFWSFHLLWWSKKNLHQYKFKNVRLRVILLDELSNFNSKFSFAIICCFSQPHISATWKLQIP